MCIIHCLLYGCLRGWGCFSTTSRDSVSFVYLTAQTCQCRFLLSVSGVHNVFWSAASVFNRNIPFHFVPSLPCPWLESLSCLWHCKVSRKVLFGGGNKVLFHADFYPLWKKKTLGWREKCAGTLKSSALCCHLADLDCPRGKGGLHVWKWGGDRWAVDGGCNRGRKGRADLGLKGVWHGCWGVGGGDGRRRVGSVNRGGVAGGDWRRVGRHRGWVGGDWRGVAGGRWGGWCWCCCHDHGRRFLCLLVLLP